MVEAVLLLEVESLVRRLDANHLSGRHDPGEINGNRAGPAAAVDEPSFIWNSLISRASGFAAPKGSVPSISIVIARPERRSRTGTDRIWISSSVDVMLYREKPTNQLALFCLPAGAASHSFSFDHRRRPETLRTAIATATVRDQMAFFGHRRFAMDSALEQRRFELMVPPRTPAFRGRHTTLAFDRLSWAWPADGDRRRSDRTVEVDACFREGAFD
jgi:hypothetical protein